MNLKLFLIENNVKFNCEPVLENNILTVISDGNNKQFFLIKEDMGFIFNIPAKGFDINMTDNSFKSCIKLSMLKTFKDKISQKLSELDWKVLRHKEQKELNLETSLSDSEYNEVISYKQYLRNFSNEKEEVIKNSNFSDIFSGSFTPKTIDDYKN